MEMQWKTNEEESDPGGEGTSEPIIEAQEAEQDIYSKLNNPTEDVYGESSHGRPLLRQGSGKQTPENVRLYRAVCLFLSILCLVLLLLIIILCMKLPTEDRTMAAAQACNLEKCRSVFTMIHPQGGCEPCGNGWLTFDGSCFYLSRYKLSWEESRKNCTARGGDLAVISNNSTQAFLSTNGYVMYWIGLEDRGNAWTWVNNTVLGQSYWQLPHQPGSCAILKGGHPLQDNWMRANCMSQTYFICQRKQ